MGLIIFLSYSHKDSSYFRIKEVAEELVRFSQFDEILYSQRDVHENFIKYMNDTLEKCNIMILFCSPISMKSKYVEIEWTAAQSLDIPIVPVFEELENVPALLRSREGVRFDPFNFQNFLINLKQIVLKSTHYDNSKEHNLLNKFKGLIKVSRRLEIKKIAQFLNISELDLFPKLVDWSQNLNFKLNGDFIIVQDKNDSIIENKINKKSQKSLNISNRDLKSQSSLRFPLVQNEDYILSMLEHLIGGIIPNIKKVDWDSFGFKAENGHITHLILHSQNLELLPEEIDEFTHLIQLGLSRNRLTEIPETLGNLKNLKQLDLSLNFIEKLPITFWNLDNLEVLSLGGNKISNLSNRINNLKLLQWLDIEDNRIKNLPEEICELKFLNYFKAKKNNLTELPENFAKLKNLTYVDLSSNRLTNLPPKLNELNKLNEFDARWNPFKSLSDKTEKAIQNLQEQGVNFFY